MEKKWNYCIRRFIAMTGIVMVAAFAGCVAIGAENEVAPVADKNLAPLRVAVYVDKGALNIGAFRWLELTARAKNVVMTPVDGEAVRRGALDGENDDESYQQPMRRLARARGLCTVQ